jgi:hypothetical protein
MDRRLEAIAAEQLADGLPGLAGSEVRATIRVADDLVNRAIAASLPPGGALRSLTIAARAGNAFDVVVDLAKPAFLPRLRATLTVVRQPMLPADPVLMLQLNGIAGPLLKLAGPILGSAMTLPPGVGLEHDVVRVDLRALLAAHGQSSHLRYARAMAVTSDEGVVLLDVVAAVPLGASGDQARSSAAS